MFIIRKDDDKITSRLQLIEVEMRSNCFIGLANIDLLNEYNTIKEYNNWKKETTNNVILLNRISTSPQKIINGNIQKMISVEYLKKMAFQNIIDKEERSFLSHVEPDRYQIDGEYLYNFSELLKQLWALEGIFFDYKIGIKMYYQNIYKAIEHEENQRYFYKLYRIADNN